MRWTISWVKGFDIRVWAIGWLGYDFAPQRYYGGGIINRTNGTHKNLYMYLLLLTIFGFIYYDPP